MKRGASWTLVIEEGEVEVAGGVEGDGSRHIPAAWRGEGDGLGGKAWEGGGGLGGGGERWRREEGEGSGGHGRTLFLLIYYVIILTSLSL